ncbi:MAG: zinc-dependent metalloprotease, partial [Robiginitalea sp.]|uniref:zinc-dependent metalloprotease n=1 Tax=Robiginitalea sp. TaxID=1902411 RepID=UPI003C733C0D
LLDTDVFGRIEYSGAVERIRSLQVRTLNNILSLGRMARLIEAEALNDGDAYGLAEMMQDLRTGLWSELPKGQEIDTYRRNLQKAHIDRLHYLLTAENQDKQSDRGGYRKSTAVNTSQSDIRSVARAELSRIQRQARSAAGRSSDAMTRYHLEDVVARIELILNPS